jgi:hypothetical protein
MRKAPCVVVLTVLSLAIVCLCTPRLDGQDTNALSAPIPTQLRTAKKIFIANGGVDAIASRWLDGDDDRLYNLVFNSAKSSGRYELVLAPADADLVWDVQFAVPTTASGTEKAGTSPDFYPQLRLTIMDPKTHIVLWTVTTGVEKAFRQKTLDKNIETAVGTLMNKLTTVCAR